MDKKERLVFGGFYRHYKCDLNGEFGNGLYQVLNTAHSKDSPDKILVIYRPLDYCAPVYKWGQRLDYKDINDWFSPVKVKRKSVERYMLISSNSVEYWLCQKLVERLYGTDNGSCFGVESADVLWNSKREIPLQSKLSVASARTILPFIETCGTEGIGELNLALAITKIDTLIPIIDLESGINHAAIINTLLKGIEFRGMVEKFHKKGYTEPRYRVKK